MTRSATAAENIEFTFDQATASVDGASTSERSFTQARMSGRWVGLSNDGKLVTGWGSMAKEHDAAEAVIARLNQEQGGVEVR